MYVTQRLNDISTILIKYKIQKGGNDNLTNIITTLNEKVLLVDNDIKDIIKDDIQELSQLITEFNECLKKCNTK